MYFSLSKSSIPWWPCTVNWSFPLGTSRLIVHLSVLKCIRRDPEAARWPIPHIKIYQLFRGKIPDSIKYGRVIEGVSVNDKRKMSTTHFKFSSKCCSPGRYCNALDLLSMVLILVKHRLNLQMCLIAIVYRLHLR